MHSLAGRHWQTQTHESTVSVSRSIRFYSTLLCSSQSFQLSVRSPLQHLARASELYGKRELFVVCLCPPRFVVVAVEARSEGSRRRTGRRNRRNRYHGNHGLPNYRWRRTQVNCNTQGCLTFGAVRPSAAAASYNSIITTRLHDAGVLVVTDTR